MHGVVAIWHGNFPHGISHVNECVVTLIGRENAVPGAWIGDDIPAVRVTVAANTIERATIDKVTGIGGRACGLEIDVRADASRLYCGGREDGVSGRCEISGGISGLYPKVIGCGRGRA